MRRLILFTIFFVTTFLSNAQYSKDYLKTEDIYKGLGLMGLHIYKYPVLSDTSFEFFLMVEEFSNGKCVDSTQLVSDENQSLLKKIYGKPLTINRDTTFLSIFVKQQFDSLYTFNFSYSFFSSHKQIILSKAQYGTHELREFKSPKITNRGKYPVLMLSSSWQQNLNGVAITRFCFPEKIDEIKLISKHFYVLSIIAR